VQLTDNKPIVLQSLQINIDAADAPVKVQIPAATLTQLIRPIPVSRLEMMWPKEHSFVPMDRKRAHRKPAETIQGVLEGYNSPD
jgi:hypothetical protein